MDSHRGIKRCASMEGVRTRKSYLCSHQQWFEANFQMRAARLVSAMSTMSRDNEDPDPLKMPIEIWEDIFRYLALPDLKNVRLSWRQWTNIASRLLFKTFVMRIDRKDFERFQSISERDSNFVGGIRILRFETGFVGLDLAQYQLGHLYRFMVNDNRLASAVTFGRHTDETIENDKTAAIAEYAAWNVRWHDANQNYRDLRRLKYVLGKLKSLDAIEITSKVGQTVPVYLSQKVTLRFRIQHLRVCSW